MKQTVLMVIIAMVCCAPYTCHAAGTSESQIKAAYIYNFAKFIKWPDSAFTDTDAPLVIGVLGQDDFDGELIPLSLKRVRNRPVEIEFYKTRQEVQACHMLYISLPDAAETESILGELKNRPIVTIGESQKFAAFGGVIQIAMVRKRLRFIINLATAKRNQIRIDAQLLSLAMEVLEVDR